MKKSYKDKKIKEQSFILNEDAVAYQASTQIECNDVPLFVTEDYRIGMKQYDNKEYISAKTVLKRIRRGI